MCRILPSSCIAASSPTWSSSGTASVDAVQLQEIDALEREVAQVELDRLPQVDRQTNPSSGPVPGG